MVNGTGTTAQPLRVLLATPYGEEGMGGIDRLNDAIAEGFAARPALGISCRRLVTRGKGSLVAAQGIFALALARFTAAALRGQCDLLHIHLSVRGSSYRKAVLARQARLLNVPYVVHLHGTDYREFVEGTNPWLRAEIGRMLAGSARIVVLGAYWAEVMRALQPLAADRIVILPNATAAVATLNRLKHLGEPLQVTFLGQLGQRKGSADLLHALALLRANRGWQASLAGDGEVEETRALARELGIADRVTVPGWLSTGERAALLARSDMLVLPSHAENLPMVILEAFAHGVPVISTPVGAIPEVVIPERNGLLVEPGDVAALSQAIARLLAETATRARFAEAARLDHARHFEMGQYLLRLAELWREARAEPARRMEEAARASL